MIGIEEFCKAYQLKPDAAIASLRELDDEVAAAILIDGGGVLSEIPLLDNGILRLEEMQRAEDESSVRSYYIANGKYLRASLKRRTTGPLDERVLNDLFEARIEYGKVQSDQHAAPELRSQSATNFGNALIETGRWIEGLDFFQEAQRLWPRNGVAALREMQCLMGFHNSASGDPPRFWTYGDLGQINQRLADLSKVVEDTYTEIEQIAGEKAVEQARHAVLQINSQSKKKNRKRGDPFIDFIESNGIALSLFCSPGQRKSGKVDMLAFQNITDKDWQSILIPEIFAMLNIMKADFALARQLFYEARFDGSAKIFRETVKSSDTLDYSMYGVQVSAMCCAQRVSYDILDKIAVAVSGYLKLENAKRATFDGIWYKEGKYSSKADLNEKISGELTAGNRGLLALYDLHKDTTKAVTEKVGFLRVLKDYRNSSTHRFTVLHDESLGYERSSGKLIDHEHVTQFEALALSSIKLARAALFYFCDAINFTEDGKPKSKGGITLTQEVPDHDFIRGDYRAIK